jgi:hypothetical protein
MITWVIRLLNCFFPHFPAGARNIEGAVKIMDYQVTKDFAILAAPLFPAT